jgi:hypothetical protein
MKKEQILFDESQRFNQWWIWVIILGAIGVSLYASMETIQMGDSFFNWTNFSIIIPVFVISVLFYFLKLKTRVGENGIYVRFIPFHRKEIFIAWDQLETCSVRTYSPLGEYGGWGIKYGLGGAGKVYNVSGNQGLQLVFKDGARLLIGTKKPTELQEVINQLGLFQTNK